MEVQGLVLYSIDTVGHRGPGPQTQWVQPGLCHLGSLHCGSTARAAVAQSSWGCLYLKPTDLQFPGPHSAWLCAYLILIAGK